MPLSLARRCKIITPGDFRLLCDRFGPSHDVTLAEAGRAMNGGKSEYDDRIQTARCWFYRRRAGPGGQLDLDGAAPHASVHVSLEHPCC